MLAGIFRQAVEVQKLYLLGELQSHLPRSRGRILLNFSNALESGGVKDIDVLRCNQKIEFIVRLSDVVGAGAAGEQAVVADAVEAVRQDVDQNLRDGELGSGQVS